MTGAAADRLEDLAWMADAGETLTGAAKRLGVKRESLDTWCRRNGQLPLLDRMVARDYDRRTA
ncbi:MAG: hypothetical protein ACRDYZ_12015 [Acidimicrobiales bacterium]